MVNDSSKVIDPAVPVLVTGASGYIGSWIVRTLLEGGYTVRGTVRNPQKASGLEHLHTLSEDHPGRLSLFKADLLAGRIHTGGPRPLHRQRRFGDLLGDRQDPAPQVRPAVRVPPHDGLVRRMPGGR